MSQAVSAVFCRFTATLKPSLLWLALLCPLQGYAADPTLPLTLAEVEQLALESEPGQRALIEQSRSMEARAVAAGALPDPQLRLGVANFPIESGGFTTEGMTQLVFGLRQQIPGGGRLKARTQGLQAQALALDESAEARGRQSLLLARQAWFELWYWQQAAALVKETQPQVAHLAEITRSLYRVGRKNQQDLLHAELQLERLDDRLAQIDDGARQTRANLAWWIGVEAAARRLPDALPQWPALPDEDLLVQGLAQHPELAAAEAQIAARKAEVDEAEARYHPDWAVDLNYGLRNGSLPSGEPRSDFLSLMLSFDLPLFPARRQDQRLQSAASEARSAGFNRQALQRRLSSELERELQAWRTLDRRIDHYDKRILGLADDQAEAALAAYQSEAGDFAEVLRTTVGQMEIRLEYSRLTVARAQAHSRLVELGGVE
ncbi:MAG: TolC family protein [Gammaproteobacteria bacterium]|nr:TolC family protein [Gammaproteobacteria bacterium]